MPIHNRSDISALLASVSSHLALPKSDSGVISVGCVPLRSPFLSPGGQKLIETAGKNIRKTAHYLPTNAEEIDVEDLFRYGTVARVVGVQGRRSGDLTLTVEGIKRFRIERLTRLKPYAEAEVTFLDDDGRYLLYEPSVRC